jgi:hypothetical protein
MNLTTPIYPSVQVNRGGRLPKTGAAGPDAVQ